MARNAFEIRISLDERLENFILLLIARLERHAVLVVALAVVVLIAPQVVRLDAEQHINIWQAARAEITCFLPGPQLAAEVAVEADNHVLFLRYPQAVHNQLAAIFAECRRDAAQMQPVKAVQQRVDIDMAEIKFSDCAVLAVINDLTRTDAIAGLEIIRSQAMRRRFLRCAQNHRRTVDVVAAQHAHSALAKAVVWHDTEKRTVYAEVRERKRNIRFTAAIARFKIARHADFLIVRRCQPKHDLPDCKKLFRAVIVFE